MEHGYDAKIMMETWNNLQIVDTNTTVLEEKTKEIKGKKEKLTCSYMIPNGKKKGQICGTWIKDKNEFFCGKHNSSALVKKQKGQLFNTLVKAFETISTSHGGEHVELTYDSETNKPIIKYKFPTKAQNFIDSIPKNVLAEFIQEQAKAKKVGEKVECTWTSTFCDCHTYN